MEQEQPNGTPVNIRNHKLRWIVGLLAATAVALIGATPASALTERPLPASDYTTHALCGAPAPGHASCFAVRLVPQTAAARAHSTPIGLTVHHTVEPASAADGAYGLRPQDLHGAYSLPTSAPVAQTVAIVDAFDDPTVEEDLSPYSQEFGLPTCTHADGCFTKVNQAGEESHYPQFQSGWAGEIALDVETVHAVCQSCHIILVEATNSSAAALEVAENRAVSMGATEVSDSFGGPEPAGEGSAFNHPGTVITASTGDDGYLNWSSSTSGYAGHPNFPASSPDVVAVGGTRLTLNGGSRTGETVWNDGSTLGGGHGAGGGGCSEHPNAQSWQQAVADWAEVGCGEKRAAADVAADADPYSGVAVYRAGSWSTVGGTSLASPIVAATFALAGGSGGVAYPTRTLYGHLGSSALHDVTSGSNGECAKAFDEVGKSAGCTVAEEEQDCQAKLICRAATGYDGPTGVGTPAGLAAFAPPVPSVSSVSPSEGDLGTEVTVEGEHLKGVSSVEFDGVPATHVVEVSATKLTAFAPGHAPGPVDVTVTTGGGTSPTSSADHFTYRPAPAIAAVTPARGPTTGGTEVTITGERLDGVASVSFDGVPATGLTQVSSTEVKVTSPAHPAGEVDVTVEAHGEAGEATSLDRFTYVEPPAVTAVEPRSGTVAGGTEVTIKGAHLAEASAVHFDAAAATDVVEVSASELTATTPAHAEGTVDVTVTTPSGTTAISSVDEFEYVRLPVVEGVAPAEGPIAGGTSVSITGHDLGGASAVTFGGTAATSFTVSSDGEISATAPAHAEGRVDVSVTTPAGTSNLEPADGFTYVAAPGNISPPAISGYPMEGRTLSASDGAWTHAPTSFTYKWLRCDSSGSNCVEIAGATAQTYQPAAADVGSTIEVEVTAHNTGGQGTATSAATNAVVARTSRQFTWSGATPRTSGPTADDWSIGSNWEGGVAPSEALNIGTLTLPSLAGDSDCEVSPRVDVCYQSHDDIAGVEVEKMVVADHYPYVLYGESFTLGAGGLEALSGGTDGEGYAPSFRMPIALGADQQWTVEGTGRGSPGVGGLEFQAPISGESHSLGVDFGEEAVMVMAGSPDSEVGPVTISGANPAKTGSEAIENGLLGIGSEAGEEPQLNATDGNPVHLKDVAMLGHGITGPLTIEGGGLDVGDPAPEEGEPYGKLQVDGTVSLDSATETSFVYGEGATAGTTYTQLEAGGNVDLGGARLSLISDIVSYPKCAEVPAGSELELVRTSGNVEGTFAGVPNGTLLDSCTYADSPVMKILYNQHSVVAKSLGPIPYSFSFSAPYTSGVEREGQTLTAHTGYWGNSPTSYDYQWLRCDSAGNGCAAIAGASSDEYALTSDDAGHRIEAEVTAHNSHGSGSATTSPTGVIATAPEPVNTVLPTISGAAAEGDALTAHVGSWENSPTSYTYQWLRCDSGGANCAAISGQVGTVYFLAAADVGHTIRLEVVGENVYGSTSATSAPTAEVTPPVPAVLSEGPGVVGTAAVGETVVANHGQWTHSPGSYSYKWLRCGSGGAGCSVIAGASEQLYPVVTADVGHTLEVEVTAHNGTAAGTATSPPSAVVTPSSPPADTSPPTISGGTTEGESLNADPGSWERAGAFAYEWLRCDSAGANCVPVAGAAGSSYTLTSADVGRRIEVRVSTSGPGGSASATSAATAVVSAQQSAGGGGGGSGGGSGGGGTGGSGGGSGGGAGGSGAGGGGTGGGGPTVTSGTAVVAAKAPVKRGIAAVALHCTGTGPCSGTLLLQVAATAKHHTNRRAGHGKPLTIGRASFSIAAGGETTVSVHLTGKGGALLRKAGKKGLHVQLAGTGLAPGQLKLVG